MSTNKPNRTLYRFQVEDLETKKTREVLLDSYATWEDLGSGILQPVRSTKNIPGLTRLKAGEALVTGGKRYKRLDNLDYPEYTSIKVY